MGIDIMALATLLVAGLLFVLLYYLKKRNVDFGIRTLLALGFGVVVGLVFKGHHDYLAAVGTIYTHAISAVVVPLLMFSIISSITDLSQSIRLKAIGLKSVLFLLLNTLIASIMALALALITKVGSGFVYQMPAEASQTEVPGFLDTIVGMFPQNLAQHWVQGQTVPLVLFAVLTALAYNRLVAEGETRAKPFKDFVDAGNLVMGKLVVFIIELTPYAVLSLIAKAVSKNPISSLLPLMNVLILSYVLCALQIFGVESLLLKGIGKISPLRFFRAIWPAGVVAFTSQSSVGTVPVTVRQLTQKLGVKEEVATFTTTLGANLGMPGCAGIWPVVLAVFAIQALQIPYSAAQYAFLIVITMVVSVGTVGVPGTATITATAVFAAAGLPVEIIVLVAPISSVVDMARTATNVVGAATAATLVAKTEGQME